MTTAAFGEYGGRSAASSVPSPKAGPRDFAAKGTTTLRGVLSSPAGKRLTSTDR